MAVENSMIDRWMAVIVMVGAFIVFLFAIVLIEEEGTTSGDYVQTAVMDVFCNPLMINHYNSKECRCFRDSTDCEAGYDFGT